MTKQSLNGKLIYNYLANTNFKTPRAHLLKVLKKKIACVSHLKLSNGDFWCCKICAALSLCILGQCKNFQLTTSFQIFCHMRVGANFCYFKVEVLIN